MEALRLDVRRPAHLEGAPRPRLQRGSPPWRGWLVETADAVAVRAQRVLERVPGTRALHRRSLRDVSVVDVSLGIGAARAGLDGLRIAFLSDVHAGSYCAAEELCQVFARVRALRPDLIALGGDLIGTRRRDLALLDGALRQLDAPLGAVAVAGNHDHQWFDDMGAWQDFLEVRGVAVLANHGLRIRRGEASVWLGGIDDLTHGHPDVGRTLAGRAPGEPAIVLAHQPDHFAALARAGVDLVLSGHTHGGQIKLFGRALVTHSAHGYVEGDFSAVGEHGPSRLHVSRGLGVSLLPLRIGARPEITLLRLEAR